ncbi:azurin [Pseudomonas sp. xss_2]|uniref:azurin n=1 Tax=Pseudomonas sp. xss_2 TaxID=3367215 RepID=UPI00370AE81D
MTIIYRLAVASLLLAPLYSFGAECAATVDSTDQMSFNLKTLNISKSCSSFTVTLNHTGKFPVNVMGHNWVLSRTDDLSAIATAGLSAGAAQDYIVADDPRVIAHTKMIGGGQSASVTFNTSTLKADQHYVFFCSFPGHATMMKGDVIVDQ